MKNRRSTPRRVHQLRKKLRAGKPREKKPPPESDSPPPPEILLSGGSRTADQGIELRENRERLATILKNSPAGILLVDFKTQKISEANPAAIEMLGFSPAELAKFTLSEMVLPPHKISSLLPGKGETGEFEVIIRTRSGIPKWILFTATAAEYRDKLYYHLAMVDRTAARKLEETWRRYDFIVNTAKDFLTLVRRDFRYEAVNQAFCDAHKKTREEIVGKTVGEIWGEPAFQKFKPYLEKCFGGKEVQYLSAFPFANLGMRNIDVTCYPYRDREGEVTHIVVISRDFTESFQKEMHFEDQLRQAQKMEALGNLAGGIAHDFNNILTAIMGFAELTQLDIPEQSVPGQNILEIITATKRAQDLVRRILTFSRKVEKKREPLHLSEVTRDGLKLLRASLPSTIEIKSDLEEKNDRIQADLTQVLQVFLNLCSNAIHSMKDRPGILTIKVTNVKISREDALAIPRFKPGSYVCLLVSDTGHGMDKITLERIFEPYFTTKPQGQGTGLGLAILHGIVTDHQGVIQVESEPGQGTRFRIYFPYLKSGSSVSYTVPPKIPKGQGFVLYVDDETPVIHFYNLSLKALGYDGEGYTDSREAFRAFQANPDKYDLILSDLTMSGMSGEELIEQIRAIRPEIPILVATGHDSGMITPERMKALKISQVLPKPLSIIQLGEAIKVALNLIDVM